MRNVPERVLAALRERAFRHGQSMQEDLRQILETAATVRAPGEDLEPVQLRTVRPTAASSWSRDEIYGDAGR